MNLSEFSSLAAVILALIAIGDRFWKRSKERDNPLTPQMVNDLKNLLPGITELVKTVSSLKNSVDDEHRRFSQLMETKDQKFLAELEKQRQHTEKVVGDERHRHLGVENAHALAIQQLIQTSTQNMNAFAQAMDQSIMRQTNTLVSSFSETITNLIKAMNIRRD